METQSSVLFAGPRLCNIILQYLRSDAPIQFMQGVFGSPYKRPILIQKISNESTTDLCNRRMIRQTRKIYEFGPFRLIPEERQLLCDNQPVPLTPKSFDLLVVLVEKSGQLIEKAELIKRVWPDSIVEEANLTVKMSSLR